MTLDLFKKRCSSCNEFKNFEFFSNYKAGSFGLQNYCKACSKIKALEYSRSNKEKIRQRVSKFKSENREHCLAQSRRYYAENRDSRISSACKYQKENYPKVAERMARYRKEKKQELAEYSRKYKANNKDMVKLWMEKYKENNQEKIKERNALRRARKTRANVAWADKWIIAEIYLLCVERSKITGVEHQVDHIVPLVSDLVCGLHCEYNLQILTKFENISKRNRWWPDMPENN